MSIVIGIDPGMGGAIAAISDGQHLEVLERMPIIGAGKDRAVDCIALGDILFVAADCSTGGPVDGDVRIVLERGIAMPGGGERKMGAMSAFSYGAACQAALDAVRMSGIPYVRILPTVWRKKLPGTPKGRKETKQAIARYVRERIPGLGKVDQDSLDAIFLALAIGPEHQ